MMPLVTVEEAKDFVRVGMDEHHEDSTLAILILAASEAVTAATGYVRTSAGQPIPARIKLAVLTHVAKAFDNRDDAGMPEGNERLLAPMRTLDI